MSFDEGLAVGLALGKKRFSGGGDSDKWTYPADWIQIPSPASNEVYCVGTISLHTNKELYVSLQNWGGGTGTCIINWGDGEETGLGSNKVAYHTYVGGTGHLTDSGMEQFLIKVAMSNPADWGGVSLRSNIGDSFCLAYTYGADTILPPSFTDYKTTHQIQLPNITTLENTVFTGLRILKKIVTPTKLTSIQGGIYTKTFGGCYALEDVDLSEVVTISNAFAHNYRIAMMYMPKLTSISSNGITGMYALREINAPLLASVGDYGLTDNYSLTKIIHADGCTFGTQATQYCDNLYPNPAP